MPHTLLSTKTVLLTRVFSTVSVNPIDVKIRQGTYDDAPDYYQRVKALSDFHIMGYDGAGVVFDTGPDVKYFKAGDEICYLANPTAQGSDSEQLLADERYAAHKPKSLDYVESAAMPLTYGTAYEALVDRLEIKTGEKAGILIINGGGGVGSIASQIARYQLKLPVVITTASRPETVSFSKKMGATHVVNHREDIRGQIRDLKLPDDVPLKYAFITSRTEQYIKPISDILAPFGKVCSIVQAKFDMYGSQFMSKSLTFVWCWLGTSLFHGLQNGDQGEKSHERYEEMARLLENGTLRCHLTRRLRLTVEGLREAHQVLESGRGIGKVALGVDEPDEQKPFT